jgi:hypothetical protein
MRTSAARPARSWDFVFVVVVLFLFLLLRQW